MCKRCVKFHWDYITCCVTQEQNNPKYSRLIQIQKQCPQPILGLPKKQTCSQNTEKSEVFSWKSLSIG